MVRNLRKGIVLEVVFVMLLVVAKPGTAYGAPGIDLEKKCSIAFVLDGTYEELHTMELSIRLYQVAEVKESGAFEALADYQALAEDLLAVDEHTTATIWEQMAETAAEIAAKDADYPTVVTMQDGAAKVKDLSTGLYLVMVEPVEATVYSYTFAPYLVALPGNSYAESGSDEWEYEVEARLKPDRTDLYGTLTIEKTLDSYNATLGGASFVFRIEAVKENKKVYSDVVSLTFDGTGSKSITLEAIPAGAEVTVAEVYSGAIYQVVSASTQQVQIVASGAAQAQAKVAFHNTYDGRLNSGSGIVNHFTHEEDGIWNWQQQ